MKKTIEIVFFSILIFSGQFLYSQSACLEFIQKKRVNDKVLIVGIGDAVTAILTNKGIVVIDAGQSPTLTAFYKKIIEKEFGQNNFAYLINTHSHHDHTGGNRVFSGIKIIAHENCINEISNYQKDIEKMKRGYKKLIDRFNEKLLSNEIDSISRRDVLIDKCRYEMVFNDLVNNDSISFPNITFSDTMNINLGNITMNLIYFGKAHTNSDIIIHIPEEKLLLIGDLFQRGGNPSFRIENNKDIEYNYNVLSSVVKNNNIQTIITGHGDILGNEDLSAFYEKIKNIYNSSAK